MVTKKTKSTSSGTRRSLATTKEEKQRVQGLLKTTTTETVVRRHSTTGGGGIDTTIHEYGEDPWERSPKTDYTYSRSATYSTVRQTEGYISPNMSRRRIHGTSTSMASPVPVLRLEDSPESDISSFTSVSQQQQTNVHAKHDTTPVRHPARRQTEGTESLSQEELDYIRLSGGVPPSTTRSGINYGMRYWWGRKHNRGSSRRRSLVTEDVTDSTRNDMRPQQKKLDYSLKTSSTNETYLPVMYGLDNYSDESDSETTYTRTTESERTSVTQTVTHSVASFFKYIYLAVITVIVTTCTISWHIIRFPYTLISSLLSKRQQEEALGVSESQHDIESRPPHSGMSYWQKIVETITHWLYLILIWPPLACGELGKTLIVGFCQWAKYRYDSFNEYHDYELSTGWPRQPTKSVKKGAKGDSEASSSVPAAEDSEIGDEEEDETEDDIVAQSCCRDIIQTFVNVFFFLVVGVPIFVGQYVWDTLAAPFTAETESEDVDVDTDEDDEENDLGDVSQTETNNGAQSLTAPASQGEEDSHFLWRFFTFPIWMLYWLLVPTPTAVGQYTIDKCSSLYHACHDDRQENIVVSDPPDTGTSVSAALSYSTKDTDYSGKLWSILSWPVWALQLVFISAPLGACHYSWTKLSAFTAWVTSFFESAGPSNVENHSVDEPDYISDDDQAVDDVDDDETEQSEGSSQLWSVLTFPVWLLHWLLILIPLSVGQYVWTKIGSLTYWIFGGSEHGDPSSDFQSETTTTTTTITTTTSEETSQYNLEEENLNLLERVFLSPFHLLYWIFVTVPTIVGLYTWNKICKMFTWLSGRGQENDVDSSYSENNEEDEYTTDHKAKEMLFMTVLLSSFRLMYWILITVPTNMGSYIWSKMVSVYHWVFGYREEIDVDHTPKEEASLATEVSSGVEEEEADSLNEMLLVSIILWPFKLLYWIVFTLPAVVGNYTWTTLKSAYVGLIDAVFGFAHNKNRSVDFDMETIEEEVDVAGLSEDELDTGDFIDQSTKEPSKPRGVLWMMAAFPVFVLYWALFGIPHAVGKYIWDKCKDFYTWLFYSASPESDGQLEENAPTNDTVVAESLSGDSESSSYRTLSVSVGDWLQRCLVVPFTFLKWLFYSLPVGFGKCVKNGSTRVWTLLVGFVYGIGGAEGTSEFEVSKGQSEMTTEVKAAEVKATKTKVSKTKTTKNVTHKNMVITEESWMLVAWRKMVEIVMWPFELLLWLFLLPYVAANAVWNACKWCWQRMVGILSKDPVLDEQDTNKAFGVRSSMSLSEHVSSGVSLLVYPFIYTGSLMKQGWSGMCHSLYRQVAGLVMADTQLLSSTSGPRRRNGLCCMLPLILLLPLLLVGLFYAYSCGGMALFGAIPIPTFSDPASKPIINEVPMASCPSGCPPQITDKQLTEKVQQIFMGLYKEREAEAAEKRAEDSKNIILQQQTLMTNHMDGVENMIKTLVQKEYVTFAAGIASKDESNTEAVDAIKVALADQEKKITAQLNQIQLQQDANIQSTKDQLKELHEKADGVMAALVTARSDLDSQDDTVRQDSAALVAALETKLAGVKGDISRLETAQLGLLAGVKDCCKNDSALALMVKAAVTEQMAVLAGAGDDKGGSTILGAAVGAGDKTEEFKEDGSSPFFMWINNQHYVKEDDVDSRIAALTARLNEQIRQQSEAAAAAAVAAAGVVAGTKDDTSGAGAGMAAATVDCSTCKGMFIMPNGTQLSEDQVKLLIKEALLIFGADKTGMVDYALESSGGSILSTRCSETYHRRTAQISLFGIPLWYSSNSPRTVIQPDVQPGQCWAFKGTQGYLVIQLAGSVTPTAFSLEHIPKALSPTGKIDSAPKDFSVWGLEHEKDLDGVLFGNFTYRDDGEPLQFFPVTDPSVGSFNVVELRIHSNHGNVEYTCLYRFRVHGHLKRW